MSDQLITLQNHLLQLGQDSDYNPAKFFKQGPSSYAQHDKFLGIKNPVLKKLAQEYSGINLEDAEVLLQSEYNEFRLLGLFFMVRWYKKGDQSLKNAIYQQYYRNINHINNWNLVDASAHYIVGAHLYDKHDEVIILERLVNSDNLWHRRIAIVATWYYIRHKNFELTLKIAEQLLYDQEDLIHKAVGWMLREVGKRDRDVVRIFLNKNAQNMPRTMLRYALEHFDQTERMYYLKKK